MVLRLLDDLHAAVLAEPDSDGPRLVYADALQAAGDPRGEWISIQCELARLGCDRIRIALWDPAGERSGSHGRRDWIGDGLVDGDRVSIRALRAREAALLRAHRHTWAPRLEAGHWFRRGFVEHAYVSDGGVAGAFDTAPMLRSLELGQGSPTPFREPRLAQLEQLRVSVFTAVERDAFVQCAQRLSVRELAFSDEHDAPVDWYALPDHLIEGLRALDAYGAWGIEPVMLERLLAHGSLEHLCLGYSRHGAGLLEAVARSEHTLAIFDCYLLDGAFGYRALAGARAFARLQALRILEQRPTHQQPPTWVDDREAIEAVVSLASLRVLDLGGNAGLVRAWSTMVEHERLRDLVQLGLRNCRIDDNAVTLLVRSPLFDRVRTLDLSANSITDRGAAELEAAQGGERLELLDLQSTWVQPAAADRLRGRFPNAEIRVGLR